MWCLKLYGKTEHRSFLGQKASENETYGTSSSYGPVDEVELGFGLIPAGAAPRVTIESIDLVSGYASEVNKLSMILGDSALQVDGVVRTGEYIWYQGGETVQVHDSNWNLLRTLPIKRRGFEFEPGNYPIQFWAEDTQPHLELQMLSFGDLILIQ